MTLKKKTDHLNDKIWGIFVEGQQDNNGHGYFRAYLEEEADNNNQPLATAICSKSKKGFFLAAANLCKRLDKSVKHAVPSTDRKWQIYLIDHQLEKHPFFHTYLLVEKNHGYGSHTAHLMAPPGALGFDYSSDKLEKFIQNGWLNSVEDATSQTSFGALGNLCRKFHYYDFASTIDSIVLEPLTAAFFLPAALGYED